MSDRKESTVFLNKADDPEIEEANKKARQTFRYFWREMCWERRRIVPALGMAAVKIRFDAPPGTVDEDSPQTEHMWVGDVDFDGQFITGTLLNEPNWLNHVHEGDPIKVPPKEVNDWMYTIFDDAYGGFTVQVMRARMGRAERKAHDQAWGLNFADPAGVQLVPLDFAGKKKGFMSKFFGSKPLSLEELEGIEHPMAVNCRDSIAEQARENPEVLTATDDHGFTPLHSFAMAGAYGCVESLLQLKANPNVAAKNGMTPIRLAKILGWRNVVQLLEKYGAKLG